MNTEMGVNEKTALIEGIAFQEQKSIIIYYGVVQTVHKRIYVCMYLFCTKEDDIFCSFLSSGFSNDWLSCDENHKKEKVNDV